MRDCVCVLVDDGEGDADCELVGDALGVESWELEADCEAVRLCVGVLDPDDVDVKEAL